MAQETASHLALLRGTGGAAAYPSITPQGGSLLGLPVLISSVCELDQSPTSRFIALLNPSQIFYADEGIELSATNQGALEMLDNPTNTPGTPTATTW